MRLTIRTKVNSPLVEVKAGFDESLFLSLNPPFPPVKLIQFDGCRKGDKVHLELNFLLFKQQWISDITYDKLDDEIFEFIDVGVRLPFFLKRWKHHHIVKKLDHSRSEIVDDISFSTPFILIDLLFYPALYLQFLYRKPVYRKIFNTK